MAKFVVICKNCDGKGRLPPLEDQGDPCDVKRFFPRLCDTCNGAGKVLSDVEIKEDKSGATDPADD